MDNKKRTRKVTEEKVYQKYKLTAGVETDFEFPSDDCIYNILHFSSWWKKYTKFDTVAQFTMPKADYMGCHFVSELIPHGLGVQFELEQVEMKIYKAYSYYDCKCKEEAEQMLKVLKDNKLIFSGYVYQSEYGQVLAFYERNVALIKGVYWDGEWKRVKPPKTRNIT